MKKVLNFIINRNIYNFNIENEKLYLPFMVVSTDKNSKVFCETNDERTFFKFKSDFELNAYDDLAVLRELYTNKENLDPLDIENLSSQNNSDDLFGNNAGNEKYKDFHDMDFMY